MSINYRRLAPEYKSWYVYWRGFYDKDFFANYFLSHLKTDKKTGVRIKSAHFHKELMSVMGGEEDALVVCPRDHAKTTTALIYYIRCIAYQQEKAILLVMSEGLGIEMIGKIRDEFEGNVRLKTIFGRLVPERTKAEQGKKWTSSQLQFMNGVEIEAVKLKGTVRGKRPTLIGVDDPQENKDVENPQVAKKFEHRFWTTVYNTLDPTGRCIVIGTVVGEFCLVQSLRKDNRGFAVVEYTAVKNPVYETINGVKHLVGGDPLRPEKWSIKVLNDRLQKIKRDPFHQEYMHIPANIFGELIWKQEDTDLLITPTYKLDTKFEGLKIYRPPVAGCLYGVDTAAGKQSGDFSAIKVRDRAGNLLASWYRKAGPEVIIQVIDYLFGLGYVGVLGIECNNETGGTTITLAKQKRWRTYIYRREDLDRTTKKKSKKDGWNTNTSTRRTMLGEYDVAIRDGEIYEITEETLEEMKTFYRNEENGKREAMMNHHDDAIMADAICWQMRKEPVHVEISG